MQDLGHRPHAGDDPGISCIAAMSYDPTRLRFITGGRDKRLAVWKIAADNFTPKIHVLPVLHNSAVRALSYRKIDHHILSGAGLNLYTTDIERPELYRKAKLSNHLLHIHTHEQDPNLSILEVRSVTHFIQPHLRPAG